MHGCMSCWKKLVSLHPEIGFSQFTSGIEIDLYPEFWECRKI